MFSADTRSQPSATQFRHMNDTIVLNSLVDVAGINSLLERTITEAGGAIRAMENYEAEKKKGVGISAWGVTTKCVNRLSDYLNSKNVELFVFHSNGEGGMILETLISHREVTAVADITLSELSMPLAGSFLPTVPGRLESAGAQGIPQVVVPGGLDMVLAKETEVEPGGKFFGRKKYQHNPEVCLSVVMSRITGCLVKPLQKN